MFLAFICLQRNRLSLVDLQSHTTFVEVSGVVEAQHGENTGSHRMTDVSDAVAQTSLQNDGIQHGFARDVKKLVVHSAALVAHESVEFNSKFLRVWTTYGDNAANQ